MCRKPFQRFSQHSQGTAEAGVGLSLTAMRKWFERALFVLILILQAAWLPAWALGPRFNSYRDPYRFAERRKALMEFGDKQTPDSQAAWDKERELLARHQRSKILLGVATFLVIDGIAIYYLWNSGRGKKKAHQSLPAVPS